MVTDVYVQHLPRKDKARSLGDETLTTLNSRKMNMALV